MFSSTLNNYLKKIIEYLFQWKAHEGLILCVAWNPNYNLIISGGEDGYAKVRHIQNLIP